jgi:nitric oxide dioxygenase
VAAKTRESSVITSFLLKPANGGKVVPHKPGRYLTFTLSPDGRSSLKRNYSISSGPSSESYRLSVKRETGGQGGSVYLHEHGDEGAVLQVAPPSGDFFLPVDQTRPVILLSAGVGLTPMVSMLESIVARGAGIDVHFIHGALNGDTHAMGHRIKALVQQHPSTVAATFYSLPMPQDVLGISHDVVGRITIDWLRANAPLAEADIYLCGPRPFLKSLVGDLNQDGVPAARIHYEYFGPADEMLAA